MTDEEVSLGTQGGRGPGGQEGKEAWVRSKSKPAEIRLGPALQGSLRTVQVMPRRCLSQPLLLYAGVIGEDLGVCLYSFLWAQAKWPPHGVARPSDGWTRCRLPGVMVHQKLACTRWPRALGAHGGSIYIVRPVSTVNYFSLRFEVCSLAPVR